jgi:hypothetical protein
MHDDPLEEALDRLKVDPDCRASWRLSLEEAGERFLRHQQAEEAAPRFASVRREICDVVVAANRLERLLSALSPAARQTLARALRVPFVGANGNLRPPAFADVPPLVDQLRDFVAAGVRSQVPKDRGGDINSFTAERGSAKDQLVRHVAWQIATGQERKFIPASVKITGGAAGALYFVAAAIYEHATGEDPATAGLDWCTRRVAKLIRKRQALAAEFDPQADWPIQAEREMKLLAVERELQTF